MFKGQYESYLRSERTTSQAAVQLCSVSKTYHNGARPVEALRLVSVEFATGQFHAIVGRSGAGKSTMLNMIAGIDRVSTGEVYVYGEPVHAMREDDLAAWRGANVGVVYQSFELLPTLTVLENVLLPMQFAGRYDPKKSPEWAMALLEQVGLAAHAYKRPGAISGGQSQRVAIARALVNKPALLVADEPTGNLDSTTAAGILELLAGLVAQGMTVIVATHDSAVSARADAVLRLVDGQLQKPTTLVKPTIQRPAGAIGALSGVAAS